MPSQIIMLLLHAEKPDAAPGETAVDVCGTKDDNGLSVRGRRRAGSLVGFFLPLQDMPRIRLSPNLRQSLPKARIEPRAKGPVDASSIAPRTASKNCGRHLESGPADRIVRNMDARGGCSQPG
jgi:hypothetical protein